MTYYVGFLLQDGGHYIERKEISNPKNKKEKEFLEKRLDKKYAFWDTDAVACKEKLKQEIASKQDKERSTTDQKPRKGIELCNRTACQTDKEVYMY